MAETGSLLGKLRGAVAKRISKAAGYFVTHNKPFRRLRAESKDQKTELERVKTAQRREGRALKRHRADIEGLKTGMAGQIADGDELKRQVDELKRQVAKLKRQLKALKVQSKSERAGDAGTGSGADSGPMSSVEKKFTRIYYAKPWGSKQARKETVSGNGSTLKYTENIRRQLPLLVDDLGVTTILDAPCGDFNWFRAIRWKNGIEYVGADVVREIVDNNQRRHGNPTRRFIRLDIISDKLPELGDNSLWLCRDCLFHLTYAQIFDVLNNFARSSIAYLLTSTHSEHDNVDIPMGKFRPLNLERSPFNLPKPRVRIEDWIEPYRVRYLALWTRAEITAWLALSDSSGAPPQAAADLVRPSS